MPYLDRITLKIIEKKIKIKDWEVKHKENTQLTANSWLYFILVQKFILFISSP
jgi:hypothetical protein